jgi:hypothetical protein
MYNVQATESKVLTVTSKKIFFDYIYIPHRMPKTHSGPVESYRRGKESAIPSRLLYRVKAHAAALI